MVIGYARVSAADQRLDLEIDALTKAGCERIFTDHASGRRGDRVGWPTLFHICALATPWWLGSLIVSGAR